MAAGILLVFPNVPHPLVSGGHLRDWQILNVLNMMGVRPHVLYFGAGEGYGLAADSPIKTLSASVEFGGDRVEKPDASLSDKVKRKLGYLFQNRPKTYPFSYQYDSAGAGKRILEHAKKVGADIVILRSFWCHHAEELHRAGLRVIANCPDYNTRLAWEMARTIKKPLSRFGAICNYLAVRRQERTFLPLCDEVWMPTTEEAEEIAGMVPPERLLVLPNLLNVGAHPDYSEMSTDEASLLFVGNFEHPPNANAARLLLAKVFPALMDQYAGLRLYLIGRGLPKDLERRSSRLAGVRVTGFVNDLTEYYRRSTVVLLPVREGAGMIFKALEALSLGKATVGFRKSFRGLGDTGDTAYVAVGSCRQMVHEVSQLLRDANRRVALGKKARAFAERELSWERGAEILKNSLVVSSRTHR